MLGLSQLVIEAMKAMGYAIRDGVLAWWTWHRKEPCDAWVYHAAMYALTPRRNKRQRKWHAFWGRRSLARCVAKKLREGKVPPRITANPAEWLSQHHLEAAQRCVALCESVLNQCRHERPADTQAHLVHRAVQRMRTTSAPLYVERDDTPVDDGGPVAT